ncbi:hypothetical protein LIT25_04010 [Bacillus sp. F19]|nr:hypothetical protein LIT25_04010 [Bacillus sp. F19]
MNKALIVLNYSGTDPILPLEQIIEDLLSQGYQIKQQLNFNNGLTYILEKEYSS